MTAPLLELRNLAGGYPPVAVFRNVNLTVAVTESVGLFGPNGQGKTTLLKTVAGTLDPWEGDVRVDGERLNAEGRMRSRTSRHLNYDLFRKRRIRARDVVRSGVIYVMQGNLLFPEMTVKEVIEIAPARIRRAQWHCRDAGHGGRAVSASWRALALQDPLPVRRREADGFDRRGIAGVALAC